MYAGGRAARSGDRQEHERVYHLQPHTGVSESSRTVVSNIHAQGTPAVEAGAYVAELIGKILSRKVSGVGLHLEEIS